MVQGGNGPVRTSAHDEHDNTGDNDRPGNGQELEAGADEVDIGLLEELWH